MRRRLMFSIAVLASLGLSTPGFADPPDHAPAHGYRAKHGQKGHSHSAHRAPGGFEVVFDPERGISIAVGFPGVVFHESHFYRLHEGLWQMSPRANGGWKPIASHAMPAVIRKALPRPGPAKASPAKNGRGGKGRKR
jgi:hypothetical protein